MIDVKLKKKPKMTDHVFTFPKIGC